MTLISKERAILFADVSGSTALYELLGDKPAAKAIEAVLGALREVISARDGVVVKTSSGRGDGRVQQSPGRLRGGPRDAAAHGHLASDRRREARDLASAFTSAWVLEDKAISGGRRQHRRALAGLAKAGQILSTTAPTANALPGSSAATCATWTRFSVKASTTRCAYSS